ncbi:MAG: hypothetical protein RID59_11975 [Hoeflea sp.]
MAGAVHLETTQTEGHRDALRIQFCRHRANRMEQRASVGEDGFQAQISRPEQVHQDVFGRLNGTRTPPFSKWREWEKLKAGRHTARPFRWLI